eukprot:Transcript_14917.p2 GENE.Transcript_14917~~Transcript_14917.p2  ORF type:complete len:439 (-),score=142.24 Transcript_14917:57-1373(-)
MAEAERAYGSLLVRLHAARARCLHEEGAPLEAGLAYGAALQELRGPRMAEPGSTHGAAVAALLHLRAAAAYAQARWDEAEADSRAGLAPELLLAEAHEHAPLRAELQQLLGLSLARGGELWGGVAALSVALELQPHRADVALQRGTLLLICERPDAAVEDLTRALQLRPGWPLATIGLLGAIPPLLSLLSAPAVGAWADRTSARDRRGRARRLGAAWGCNAANGLGVLGAGLCLWAASDASHARGGAAEARGFSVGALVLLILAFPLGTATMGPFWALHHSAQPAPLHAVSIATINSIGNLGGFVGPYLLAALRDWLGPDCPPGREGTCVSQWAFGTIGLSLGALAVVAASGATAARLLLSAHAGGVGGGRAAADGGGVARRASPPGMPLLAVDGGAAAVRQSFAGGEPATPADEADDGVPLWVVPASKERLAGEGGR